MIFFFAGAPKNGSHLQLFVVRESLDQLGLPYRSVGNEIFHARDLKRAGGFLRKIDADSSTLYLCKGHFGLPRERELLLSFENIRIFLIWRDFRDALVSHYYYRVRKYKKAYADFSNYYWTEGRTFLLEQIHYRLTWSAAQHDHRVVSSSFSMFVKKFPPAALRLLSAADIRGVDIQRLQQQLSLSWMRKVYNDPRGIFFRKGSVGEYRRVITSDRVLSDINRLTTMNAIVLPSQFLYEWWRRKFTILIRGLKEAVFRSVVWVILFPSCERIILFLYGD